MSKFLHVQLFGPELYDFHSAPFWINVDYISKVTPYQIEIHSLVKFDSVTNKPEYITPEGAKDTVYITIDGTFHHLDVESSKKVLNAIGARKEC